MNKTPRNVLCDFVESLEEKMDTMLRHFTRQVIVRRNEKKLSQIDLAELVDCHINTINNIECGRRTPSFEMALKLSKALSISLDEMMNMFIQELEV
jgi:transcriptional regulator with XRE-family HTH domain